MSLFEVDKFVFDVVSNILLAVTGIMMVYSAYKYFEIYRTLIKSDDPMDHINLPEEIKTKK